VKDVTIATASDLGLTGRISRLTLDTAWPAERAALRTVLTGTTVLAAETPVVVADESIDALDIEGDELELEGVHVDLVPGRWVVVSGERVDPDLLAAQDGDVAAVAPAAGGSADPPLPRTGVLAAELSMIAAVEQRVVRVPSPDEPDDLIDLPGDSVHTFLRLAAPLAYQYLRPSVTVYGNVVPASHGQTRAEVLGAGDATRPHAEFPLKQPPLTYVPAPTSAGASSTLTVFVDGVAWQQVDDLIDAGPLGRDYLLRADDAGSARVVFGDGTHGAIPPTGTENITASYRSGMGLGGNLETGRITLLTTKPLGVTEVTNPIPATGGADPEGRDVIRDNAPLTVQALDRLVSVADYQAFAQVFAGIGSSDARALSDGVRQVVHVTIAGIADAPIDPSSDLVRNLTAAMSVLGDPDLAVQVAVRRLRLLVISARIRIDPDRRWSDVESVLRATLLDTFGPDRARIGRPLAQAAVLATMQAVPGVRYADLDVLDSLDEDDLVAANPAAGLGLLAIVPAAVAQRDPDAAPGVTAILPGELLRLDPGVPDTVILTELTGP
jgi:predicted phage baseplate assembly protein